MDTKNDFEQRDNVLATISKIIYNLFTYRVCTAATANPNSRGERFFHLMALSIFMKVMFILPFINYKKLDHLVLDYQDLL